MSTTNYELLVKAKIDTSTIEKQLSSLGKKYTSKSFNNISNGIYRIGSSAKSSLTPVDSLYNTLRNFNNITNAIQGTVQFVEALTQAVFELDDSLTQFKKVSDLSGEALDKYTQKASELGDSVARTTSQMIDAATEFRKSGYNDDDSLILGQIAEMYANVADSELSAGDASSFIISQMKAFNIEASDATEIIDKVNEV